MNSMKVLQVINHSKDHTEVIFENKNGRKIDYEVFLGDNGEHGMCRNGEDYAGIWVDSNNSVRDYDMVYELSSSAIVTLREAGVTVPVDFEPEA